MHYAAQGSFIGRYLPPKREYRSHAASAIPLGYDAAFWRITVETCWLLLSINLRFSRLRAGSGSEALFTPRLTIE